MPKLKEYERKRDFSKTPEPEPHVRRKTGQLAYVIQKHAASHLHYDFRIELDGVLLSWAVPKGPSLDPADKRLAMRVEDHPVEYGGFEGVIPEGEYGGGTVMIWDRGTWEPDHGDPREHLAEGHLKFELHGERLRGRWMLVRTKGYGSRPSDKESWLLFKERDEEARPRGAFDPLSEWSDSVATGRSMDEIATGKQAIWHSDKSVAENAAAIRGKVPPAKTSVDPADLAGAARSAMTRAPDPALATLVSAPPEGGQWLHEVKFDGYRILALVEDGVTRLKSRNHNDWTDRFPEIAAAVSEMIAESAIIDGEVVVFREDGTTDFQALQNHAKSGVPAVLSYMAFDLLYLDGWDLTSVALEERKRALRSLIPGSGGAVRYSDHIAGNGGAFLERACETHLEGIVSKRRGDPYRTGRSRSWLKSKCLQRQEFVIVGWTDPAGARKEFGALVLGVREDGALRRVGKVGTGFTEASLKEVAARLAPLAAPEPPVSNPPKGVEGHRVHWVSPELVAEVAFSEWTSDGSLRQPVFLGMREDKKPGEVVREKPVDPRDPGDDAGRPVVAGVLLTNPDRVLWPDVGLTKMGLARHYESVAELMLPHVSGRPLSLVRCPEGYTGECFYQKHIQNFPSSVGTVDIFEPEEGREEPYGTVRDLAGLVGLVQMGVLEIHPWGARNDHPDKPDRIVFDLDPDKALPFRQVAATALLIKSELGRLGLDSWVKSTGGKGLHVVVPLVRNQGWDTVKDFSRAFVESIVAIEPRMFTSNMSKAKRGGRIFIDYLRNARGATAVAPYSTRARPGAPVALPLSWKEIEDAKMPIIVSVGELRARLDERDGDPWSDIGRTLQRLTKAMLESVSR